MKVFEKVRLMRELKKWSQEHMAEKLQMSTNGYSKIERGETQLTIPRLQQIAEIFEMDAIELLQEHEQGIVLLIGENNANGMNNINLYNGSTELAMEIDKLKLIIQHQHELLEQKERELITLKEMIQILLCTRQKNKKV